MSRDVIARRVVAEGRVAFGDDLGRIRAFREGNEAF